MTRDWLDALVRLRIIGIFPNMIFDRVKPLDAILAAAEKKSLKRTLGWFQLMLFGIGCVIGTGIFVLTSAARRRPGRA